MTKEIELKSYVKQKDARKESNPYLWERGCHFCKKSFEDEEVFIRIDVQNDNFRGNDDVYCFHRSDCFGAGLEILAKNYGQKLTKES